MNLETDVTAWDCLPMKPLSFRPRHPDMIFYEDRLATFNTWSKQIIPNKFSLAEAGFFYSGQSDVTICAFCSLRLSDWSISDIPLTEHLRHVAYIRKYLVTVKIKPILEQLVRTYHLPAFNRRPHPLSHHLTLLHLDSVITTGHDSHLATHCFKMEDGNQIMRILDIQFTYLCAKAVVNNIETVTRQQCYGCQVDHPSQTQHPCLMWNTEEKLCSYLNDIIQSVNQEEVLKQWCEDTEKMDISPDVLAMYKLKYLCDDWRNMEMNSNIWREKLYEFAVKLIQLESRF